MKKYVAIWVLIGVLGVGEGWGQVLFDSFSDGNFTNSPSWGGNTGDWTIVANSDVSTGATGSQTLRLSAPATSATRYLSSQIAEWGVSQEWGFFIGRRGQAFTAANQQYFWLFANEANLNNTTVDGYRIAIGDDSGGDEFRLQYIVNGAVSATVITSTGSIPNGTTDIGVLVRVTRSATGVWEMFTSTLPVSNATGAIATDIPSSTNANVNQGSATNNSLSPASNFFLGVAALHSTGASAIVAAEFDQIYFTTASSNTITTGIITGAPFCIDGSTTATVSVPYSTSGTFTGTFTAQLSNSSGSFVSPTNIGTGISPISGTIPAALATGTGYRIRVVNDNPTVSGSDNGTDLVIINGPAEPSTFAASVANASTNLTWTNPVGCFDEFLIVCKAGSGFSLSPSGDGSAYTGSLAFGSGTAFDGGFVVYKGSASGQTVTNLSNGTTYFFKLFSRRGSSWSSGVEINVTPSVSSNATDHFRSRQSGNWQATNTWESSSDSISWINSTLVPTSSAASIDIRSPHTVSIAAAGVSLKGCVIRSGGILFVETDATYQIADGTGFDLIIQSGGLLDVTPPEATNPGTPTGTGTALVQTGGKVRVNAAASGTNVGVAFINTSCKFTYADEAIFEWNVPPSFTHLPTGASQNYFTTTSATDVPILLFSQTPLGQLGAAVNNTFNCLMSVSSGGNLFIQGSGTKTFRGGFAGSGTITQSAGTIAFNSNLAVLDSSINLVLSSPLTLSSGLTVPVSATGVRVSGANITKSSGNFTVNGDIDLTTISVSNASGNVTVSSTGTIRTANTNGIYGTGATITSGTFNLNSGSTIWYNASGNQTVTRTVTYQNLRVSGTGMKTAASGGSITVQGTATIQSGGTFALSGILGEDLNLSNTNGVLTIDSGAIFDNNGESQVTFSGGSPAVTISGTFITRDEQGFVGTGAAIPGITPTLNTGCTINYARAGAQAVQGTPNYQNLVASGSGTKTLASAITTTTSLTISGTAIFEAGSNTVGGASTDFTMTGGRFRSSQLSGTQPTMGGTYTLTGGTVELYGTNGSQQQSLRGARTYFNVELNAASANTASSNILHGAGNITIVSGGSLTINSPVVYQVGGGNAVVGAGNFVLSTGATLKYGDGNGIKLTGTSASDGNIRVSGTRTFPTTASYGLTGTTTPQVVGDGLPSTVENFYIQKDAEVNQVTLGQDLQVNGNYVHEIGTLNQTLGTLRLNGTSNTVSTTGNLNISGILDLRENELSGAGDLNIQANGTLRTAHADGVNGAVVVSGTKTFDPTANYHFTRNGNQNLGFGTIEECGNMLIADTTTLLMGTAAIELSGTFTNAGTVDLLSGGSIMQSGAGTNTGSGNYLIRRQGFVGPRYNFMGSPVNNSPASVLGNQNFRYRYNEAVTILNFARWVQVPNASTLVNGQGYTSWNSGLVTFNGVINNGPITVSNITHTVITGDDPLDRGWNLVANPYPSAISAASFVTGNTNIDGTLYLWVHEPGTVTGGNEDYLIYNEVGDVTPPAHAGTLTFAGNIASGQGFFIRKTTPGNESISFTNAMRVRGNNNEFFRPAQFQGIKIKLAAFDSTVYNETLIAFMPGATDTVDRLYDGIKLQGNDNISLYSRMGNLPYAIQALAPLAQQPKVVPLGISLLQGKTLRWKATEIIGLDSGITAYLVDSLTQQSYLLTDTATVWASSIPSGTHNQRFYLVIQPAMIAGLEVQDRVQEERKLLARVERGTLYGKVYGTKSSIIPAQIQFRDIQGRVLAESPLVLQENGEFQLRLPPLAAGLYMVQYVDSEGRLTSRCILETH